MRPLVLRGDPCARPAGRVCPHQTSVPSGRTPAVKYRARMGKLLLSAEDIRAAAEVHRELGPDYGDAVVESFLARIDQHIDARVEQQLASKGTLRRRQVDPARLSKYRTVLAGFVGGTIVAGVPLTLIAWVSFQDAGRGARPLMWMWVVIVAIYGLAAYRLRRR
jgi:hypothetical protein